MERSSPDSSSARGADSASASATSDEAVDRARRDGPGLPRGSGPAAELSSALGSLLRRTSQLEEASTGRFSEMFRELKSDDTGRQLMALTQLSEYLSFSSEDSLVSFPMEQFIPVLVNLLEDPGTGDELVAQSMLLSGRCLFNLVDSLPPTAKMIAAAGGLQVLCANLLNVAYIDVAELAVAIIERIAEDQPLHVLKAGGLQAILTFLDFFQITVQRQAASAASLMLVPVPPRDVFEQHVRPVLPTLVQLLQHQDPQVLRSICECWRRVLDSTIAAYNRPQGGASPAAHAAPQRSSGAVPSASLSRMVSKGKWRGSNTDRGKSEEGPGNEAAPPAAGRAVPIATVLEEMCPSGVLSNLILLLTTSRTSPSPQSSAVAAEVLYVLAVTTAHSDTFTGEVLQQDLASILRQMMPAAGPHAGAQGGPSVLRILATVASLLPALRLVDGACECEERRLQLFRDRPELLDRLAADFLPALVDVYEAAMDPCTQGLCVTLLLTFLLVCRERPDAIRANLDPTRVACFLANQLQAGASRSTVLACLLLVYELLGQHSTPYSQLFVRHGVVRAIHCLVDREDDASRGDSRVAAKAAEQKNAASTAAGAPAVTTKTRPRSKARLVQEAASRALSSHLASSPHTDEPEILKPLERIASQLRSSPQAVVPAHREALARLHDLLLAPEGITAFEFTCSGTAEAVRAFLYPPSRQSEAYGDRLRLFLECFGGTAGGAFVRLVRLTVSSVTLLEQQPVTLFPTSTSSSAALPPHLRSRRASQVTGVERSPFSLGGLFGDGLLGLGLGAGGRGRGQDSSAASGASASISVLKLLAKPIRVRLGPHGTPTSSPGGPALPTLRTMLVPCGGQGGASAGSAGPPDRAAASASASSQEQATAVAAPSPATRLKNYFASKVPLACSTPVNRKRSASSSAGSGSAGAAVAAAAGAVEKRTSGVAIMLAKAAAAQRAGLGRSAFSSGARSSSGDDAFRGPGDGAAPEPDEGRDARDPAAAIEAAMLQRLQGGMRDAVLLVEPLASVSALEDYVRDRHGPPDPFPRSAPAPTSSFAGPGAQPRRHSATPGRGPAPSAAETSGAASRPAALPEPPAPGSPDVSPQFSATTVTPERDEASPDQASLPPAAADEDEALGGVVRRFGARGATGLGQPDKARKRRRVQIRLNGQPLQAKTSVVQALVAEASRSPHTCARGDGRRGPRGDVAQQGDRFLVSTEEDSASDVDDSADPSLGQPSSSRNVCGAIWGRVHAMTFEFVDDVEADAESAMATGQAPEEPVPAACMVGTDFDALVHVHGTIPQSMASLQAGGGPAPGPGAAAEPAAEDPPGPAAAGSSVAAVDHEALAVVLQLAVALHNLAEYLRISKGPLAADLSTIPDDDDFLCSSLSNKLLRQLSDPLAICTGSIPAWCTQLVGACRFLFPHAARRVLHHSCNLGLARALHHVQQRTLAQAAHGQEQQRRLEGEVAVASIPRQKVRISRQRLLESAVKVMSLYGGGATILEVEYVGEVGTGSGPTLEFYAQVADMLRTSEPKLFREGVPGGMLFPEPREPTWLQSARPASNGQPATGDPAAQQILERFRLLGQVVAKCILDNRLVDLQLHPLFWRAVLGTGPFATERALQDIDPALAASLARTRCMDAASIDSLCVDFTLPGRSAIELRPGGAACTVSSTNIEEYVQDVARASLVTAVAPQVQAFREAFAELLPLDACAIWYEAEMASIIAGSSVRDDALWTVEHLGSHIKAQHGYQADSRNFRDLLKTMEGFSVDDRRSFLMFATGAPALPVNGFAGLKPPLTVVKKEAPPPPLTPDDFMPSVMTCANYLKLPEYSTAEILQQKLCLAMREGQSAFLLS